MRIALFLLAAWLVVSFVRRWRKAPPERRLRCVMQDLGVVALLYGAILVMLVFFEKMLVFPRGGGWDAPGSLAVEEVWLTSADGNKIHAWWCPVDDARCVVHYSHGNGGNLSHRADAIRDWQDVAKASVLIYDYPGYGRSSGSPSETGCVAAGQAAYNWLRDVRNVSPGQIVLYGKSLGGGVATELAMHNDHRLLVLFCPFTSIPDMAQSLFPFLPARYLVRTRFDNLSKLSTHAGPVLIGHGTNDGVIPHDHSERLHAACRMSTKKLLLYPGAGHAAPPRAFLAEAAALLTDSITRAAPPR